MYKSGNYYAHKFTIEDEQKIFYSKEKTKTAAWVDICEQKAKYEEESRKQHHNFKCLADKMMQQQERLVGYKCTESYECGLKHLQPFFHRDIQDITALDNAIRCKARMHQLYAFIFFLNDDIRIIFNDSSCARLGG